MTVTDRTDATDAEFEARLERLDRLEVAEESAEERVARAIFDEDNPIVESFPDYWERVRGGDATRGHYRRLARAAIAALKPAPGTDECPHNEDRASCAVGCGRAVTITISADDYAFLTGFHPDRDRTASRADMVRVIEHMQAALSPPPDGGDVR